MERNFSNTFILAEDFEQLAISKNHTKKAFTLAEVLVTLGIIGVVSALTLPTLVKSHQRQVYVTQLKKVVNELSQAGEKAIQENNVISLDESKYNRNNANGARNFFNDNLKIANNCGTDLTPCFASSYKTLNGTEFTLERPQVVLALADGASILVFGNYLEYRAPWSWTDSQGVKHYGQDHGALQLQIDVNGSQGPNILGRDLFYMELYSDGKVAETYSGTSDWKFDDYCLDGSGYGLGCFDKIVTDGWKMDY